MFIMVMFTYLFLFLFFSLSLSFTFYSLLFSPSYKFEDDGVSCNPFLFSMKRQYGSEREIKYYTSIMNIRIYCGTGMFFI